MEHKPQIGSIGQKELIFLKVLVTPRSFASTSSRPLELLEDRDYRVIKNTRGRTLKREEMEELVGDVDGVIIGIDPLDGEIISRAGRLRVISKYGVGMDNIDLDAARKSGIVVTNTPTANNDAVADLTLGLMLALARRIPEADRKVKADGWEKMVGKSLWEKRLGIIGLGRIGRRVVERARGFEMEIMAYDPYEDREFAARHNVRYVRLEELLKRADFVTLHTPLNDDTRGLIGSDELELMSEGAFLINTSRGGIVDEGALYEALRKGRIRGAALDAFAQEPPGDSPLRELDNVIMTPHMGAHTEEAITAMGVQAAENLIAVLEGREPESRIV